MEECVPAYTYANTPFSILRTLQCCCPPNQYLLISTDSQTHMLSNLQRPLLLYTLPPSTLPCFANCMCNCITHSAQLFQTEHAAPQGVHNRNSTHSCQPCNPHQKHNEDRHATPQAERRSNAGGRLSEVVPAGPQTSSEGVGMQPSIAR